MGRLTGKNAIITGGNRGIGLAIALAYAKEGADIAFSYNTHEEEAKAVVQEIQQLGRKAIAIKADISNEKEREALAQQAIEFLGVCHILVNNAGVYFRQDYLDVSEQDYDTMMNINLKGAFFFTQFIVRHMQWQQVPGCVINISSFRDQAPTAGLATYQIGKVGLTMFSDTLAIELAKYGIRFNTISPGMVETNMLTDKIEKDSPQWQERIDAVPLKRPGRAEEVADTAVYLATSEYSTGTRIVIDGGRRFSPLGMLPSKL